MMAESAEGDAVFKSSKQLESKITKLEEQCNSSKGENNACIRKKLDEVKAQYAEIIKEGEAIKDAQKEAAEFFKNQITLACTALMKIQLQPNGSEVPEELRQLEQVLGIKSVYTTDNSQTSGHEVQDTSVNVNSDSTCDSQESSKNLPANVNSGET